MGSRRLRCWISPLGLRPLFAIQHHSATNRYFSVNYCRLLLQFAKIKEMQKMKEEITQEVLESISVNIENKIRQTLDELFMNNNI